MLFVIMYLQNMICLFYIWAFGLIFLPRTWYSLGSVSISSPWPNMSQKPMIWLHFWTAKFLGSAIEVIHTFIASKKCHRSEVLAPRIMQAGVIRYERLLEETACSYEFEDGRDVCIFRNRDACIFRNGGHIWWRMPNYKRPVCNARQRGPSVQCEGVICTGDAPQKIQFACCRALTTLLFTCGGGGGAPRPPPPPHHRKRSGRIIRRVGGCGW